MSIQQRLIRAALLCFLGLPALPAHRAAGAEAPATTQPAGDIDSVAYWKQGREQIARLGNGFIVWEARRKGHWSIWTIQLDGNGLKQLTPVEENRDQQCPQISPDGKRVAYLSLPRESAPPETEHRISLHLINADGTDDRVIVPDAHKYGGGWDRAVVWFTPQRLAYVAADNDTYEMDLATGKSKVIITGGGGWLPNTTMTNVVQAFNTFSLFDPESKTVTPMPHLGGCMPYFTQDGKWGFWMANMGGPIGKMRLATREWSPLLEPSIMPKERNYCYFPNVSSSQCLLAFAAANHEKLRGGYGGYDLSDYNVFIVQIDPQTLDVLGQPVRYSFDPVCNRFPCVYQPPLALGFKSNKAPFDVDFSSPGTGDWAWDFGDATTAKGASATHAFDKPGLYIVSAVQGEKVLHGEVRVLPASAPKALAAALEGEKTVLVTFDQAVNLKNASVQLESGGKIEKWTPSPEGLSLRAMLAVKPAKSDAVLLQNVSDLAQHPNKMEPARLVFEPRLWPTNPQGLVFVWQTANQKNQMLDPTSGKLTAYRFRASDTARLDENFALRPDGGSFLAIDFGLQFGDAVRKTNAYSMELTVTPEPADNDRIRCLCSYDLFQRGDKLFYRGDKLIELCTLPPGIASHLLLTYTPGHLVFYLNGSPVFSTEAAHGDLRGMRGNSLVIGNDLDNQPWFGTVEGIAIFDHVLSPGEAQAEAEAYRHLREKRKPAAMVELEGTLTASSRAPRLAQIAPYRQGMIVNEYAVKKVIAGKLEAKKIRVAHWGILDEQTLEVNHLPLGEVVHLIAAPFAACPQLEGEHVTDTLPQDFDAPLFYAASAQWDHHFIPHWTAIGGFIPKPQDPNIEHGKAESDLAYVQEFGPEKLTGLPQSFTPARKYNWTKIEPDAEGFVNLFKLVAPNSASGCGYAVVYVKSPAAKSVILHAGTVGGFKAWLNGKQFVAGHFGRYPYVGHEDTPIELQAGWNELLVKSTQLYAFWGFTCDLLTPDGKLITDLTYSSEKN